MRLQRENQLIVSPVDYRLSSSLSLNPYCSWARGFEAEEALINFVLILIPVASLRIFVLPSCYTQRSLHNKQLDVNVS